MKKIANFHSYVMLVYQRLLSGKVTVFYGKSYVLIVFEWVNQIFMWPRIAFHHGDTGKKWGYSVI